VNGADGIGDTEGKPQRKAAGEPEGSEFQIHVSVSGEFFKKKLATFSFVR
jgi:hypothetical protein